LLIQATLKEELTKQPYAGLFICYMLNRFEDMNEDDFVYWDRCCQFSNDTTSSQPKGTLKNKSFLSSQHAMAEEIKRDGSLTSRPNDSYEHDQVRYGVYKTELVLLSKSQQSRFSRFILEFGLNRKDDRYRSEALKFIECLRYLSEYEALVEEGTEEAI
jgi:hypothetical protein